MVKVIKLLFFILTFTLGVQLHAQNVIPLQTEETGFIGKSTEVLIDTTGQLSIAQALKNQDFSINTKNVFSPAPDATVFWCRFKVINPTNQLFYLEIDNPSLDELDVYTINQSKITHLYQLNKSRPFSFKTIATGNFIIPIQLPKDDTISFYIRYRALSSTHLPLRIALPHKVLETTARNNMWYGVFYGIFFLAILYNFFLYITMREKSYIIYVALVITILIYFSWSAGHIYQYILPQFHQLNQSLLLVLAAAIGFIHMSFVKSFLNTKETAPTWNKTAGILQGIYLSYLIFVFVDLKMGIMISALVSLVTVFYPIAVGIYIYRKGYEPARFYIIAYLSNFVCVIIYIFKGLGYIPHTFLTNNILFIGFAIEIILLSFALGDQYKRLRQEREEAQRNLNYELELKIHERNKVNLELQQINQSLVQTNADLDSFIYVASHNLQGPVSSVEGLVNILELQLYQPEEFQEILSMMRSSIQKFKTAVFDLTEISRLQKIYSKEDIENNDIYKVLEEIKIELHDSLQEVNGVINSTIPQGACIRFSHINIRRILLNLLINSIKFHAPNKTLVVDISINENSDFVILSVSDNGIGISPTSQQYIFSMFKKGHEYSSGQGVGLYIVKRAIENEGGKVEVESEEGLGTTFRLYFKKCEEQK